ncbi:MAG: membrane integrity-associated transporter subunit PqiC [Bauldia sp.]|nr:membrane integrity-associated transporter subunit PqiC [Bauldia sp.]
MRFGGQSLFQVAFGRVLARVTVLALGAGLLAGCALFSGSAPPTFNLSAPSDVSSVRGSTQAQILVPESTALEPLNSERILVVTGNLLSYYPDAQWVDRLPRVIQARIIETLERTGRARAAGRPGQGLSIDYQLLTDIRAFEFRTDGGLTAVVEIYAQIMDDRNGRVITTETFRATTPVAEDSASAIAASLDAALRQVLLAIANWTLARI